VAKKEKDIEPGQLWQNRRAQSKYVQVLRAASGGDWWVADIDTARESVILAKTLLREYRLTGQELHPGGFKPERSAHLQDARDKEKKPAAPQIAAGQHFHLRDDLADTLMVIGPGNRPGMWTCQETSEGASDRKFQMSEQLLADDYVLIVEPAQVKPAAKETKPEPAVQRDPKPANGNGAHHDDDEDLDQDTGHARLMVNKAKVACPCGDVHEIKAQAWDVFIESVAQFRARHARCLKTNVLPFGEELNAPHAPTNGEAH
jgi:hypothetical protein